MASMCASEADGPLNKAHQLLQLEECYSSVFIPLNVARLCEQALREGHDYQHSMQLNTAATE
eukprot:5440496-Amphidinium_carterae.1